MAGFIRKLRTCHHIRKKAYDIKYFVIPLVFIKIFPKIFRKTQKSCEWGRLHIIGFIHDADTI